MAVKRLIVTVDDRERKTLQMDLTVIMKAECPFIVKFYGALFREGEVSGYASKLSHNQMPLTVRLHSHIILYIE